METIMENWNVKWYPFTEHPNSDSCWSLSVGPDGRIYAASCAEMTPGETVKLVRYNEQTDGLDFLFDLDKMVDDPRDSGRATQCKIHYSFAPSMSDGILYMATHLSGPPIDEVVYSPWASWHDTKKCFRGSALLAFDTRSDQVLWWNTLIPKEGCRCLLHDEERGLLYAISYPRDHMVVFDIKTRQLRDLGRIGSVNTQALILDKKHRVWTTCDDGKLVRYDPDIDRLEWSPTPLPHDPRYQTGLHSVLYDVAPAPDGESVYAGTWIGAPRLMRIWPMEGEFGRVEDLGPSTQKRDLSMPANMFIDHCGGLVFGGDGSLYFVASRWQGQDFLNPKDYEERNHDRVRGVLWRFNPESGRREEITELERPGTWSHYVSRGAVDHNGDLFFGHVGPKPVGIFKVAMPSDRKKKNAHLPIRMWG